MPDRSKLEALRDAGFTIADTCLTCAFWLSPGGGWGRCGKIRYGHEKHTQPAMHAGTPSNGACPQYERSEKAPDHYPELTRKMDTEMVPIDLPLDASASHEETMLDGMLAPPEVARLVRLIVDQRRWLSHCSLRLGENAKMNRTRLVEIESVLRDALNRLIEARG